MGFRRHDLYVCLCPIKVMIKQTDSRGMNSGLQDKNSQMILSQGTSGELKITSAHTHPYTHMSLTLIIRRGSKCTQSFIAGLPDWMKSSKFSQVAASDRISSVRDKAVHEAQETQNIICLPSGLPKNTRPLLEPVQRKN